MPNIYVIVDTKMNVDTFPFMQQTHGAAASYFYNWSLMQQHRQFALYTVGEFEYVDNQYVVTKAERNHICDLPDEDD